MRTEFGHERTNCDCEICVGNCKVMPGFLIPSDLDRLIPKDTGPLEWSESNLLASPGAVVMRAGEIFRIPTLVPQSKSDGSCMHLQADNLCGIHDNSPFGCAFFDCTSERNSVLAQNGLLAIERAFRAHTLYFRIWVHLSHLGKTREGPEVLRKKFTMVGVD